MSREIISIRLSKENEEYFRKMLEKENESLSSYHMKFSNSDLLRKIIHWSYLENLDNDSMTKIDKILNNKTKKLLDILLLKQQTLKNNLSILIKLIEKKYGDIVCNSMYVESNILKEIERELEENES